MLFVVKNVGVVDEEDDEDDDDDDRNDVYCDGEVEVVKLNGDDSH